MRLTNMIRDAFIRAAMHDVPTVDYKEEIRQKVQADAIDKLPPKVRTVYNDKGLRHFINTASLYVGGEYVNVPCGDRYAPSPEFAGEMQKIQKLSDGQFERHNELRSKLRGCAYACSTRKALLDMLPEFEKYMPADEIAACRTLPVVANVVSDFVKAGWPNGTSKSKVQSARA